MANGQLKRILRRGPSADDAETELLQIRVLARLQGKWQAVVDEDGSTAPGEPEPEIAAEVAQATETDREPDVSEAPEIIQEIRIVQAPEVAQATEIDDGPEVTEAPEITQEDVVVEGPVIDQAPEIVEAPILAALAQLTALPHHQPIFERPEGPNIETHAPPMPAARPAPRPAPRKTRPTAPRNVRPTAVAVAAASNPIPYCPYCALLLDPPPESSRRCPRCKERIVVKRVAGRAIYITEAALAIFEAERRRVADSGRWSKERSRWLNAAAAADAPPAKLARLDRAPLSEEVVASARSLYFTTVDRSYRSAKRERRWEDASRIMRAHAMVLFKLAGSPIPPPDESVEAHRLGATAALRGLDEMSRVAELVSGRCCDTCRADDGGLFKIALELRQPRLPHAGCPKGLCRCDWFLAVRDQSRVRRHLRRRARTESAGQGST